MTTRSTWGRLGPPARSQPTAWPRRPRWSSASAPSTPTAPPPRSGRSRFGSRTPLAEHVPNAARIALECIGNSDALYHNVEHTLLVTLAGHDILRGRTLHTHLTAEDYAHVIIACLTHDIGYVRGLFE